jgi:hypothetical protein
MSGVENDIRRQVKFNPDALAIRKFQSRNSSFDFEAKLVVSHCRAGISAFRSESGSLF